MVLSFLTHEDKVQVRYMGWAKFLWVSSNFDCFLTNGYCVVYCFSTKNSREHALRLFLCPERGLFKGFIWLAERTIWKDNIVMSMSWWDSTHDVRESIDTVSQFSLGMTYIRWLKRQQHCVRGHLQFGSCGRDLCCVNTCSENLINSQQKSFESQCARDSLIANFGII